MKSIDSRSSPSKVLVTAAGLGFVGILAVVDYLIDPEISLSVFYLVPVFVVLWFAGPWQGALVAVIGCGTWLAVELLSGPHYSNALFPFWNASIRLMFFLLVVFLLSLLRRTNQRLQTTVTDLQAEIAERRRLETEILEVSEREQQRIGQDIHDSLCQHLAGAAVSASMLQSKLAKKAPQEAPGVGEIAQSRNSKAPTNCWKRSAR